MCIIAGDYFRKREAREEKRIFFFLFFGLLLPLITCESHNNRMHPRIIKKNAIIYSLFCEKKKKFTLAD